MSTQYLKKTKMYNLLKDIIEPEYMPKMSECEYRFYRGSEWLIFYIGFDFICKLYHRGVGFTLDFDSFNDFDVRVSWDILTFAYLDDKLILNYWRKEHNQFVKSCISKTA